jgi:extradiol dioxygenase family protein
MSQSVFHLSLPCYSISKTTNFYVDVLDAKLGRYTTQWVDIDLYGNQITFTKAGEFAFMYKSYKFEDSVLPAFHFGVILNSGIWEAIHHRISKEQGQKVKATTYLAGKQGEHTSFFVEDPNGFVVEFKCFKETNQVFAS